MNAHRTCRRREALAARALTALLLAASLCLALAPAHAGSLGISPMRVDFAPDRSITHVTLTNPTQETLSVELEAQPWLADTPGASARDLTVNPPTATLKPGAKLTVRIGLTKRLAPEHEHAYRLYVTELPQPLGTEAQGISVRLRVGIPVFVAAAKPEPAALQWNLARDERGLLLVAHNPGNVHERVHGLTATPGPASPTLALSGPSYVLAGGRAEFLLPATFDTALSWRLQGRSARGAIDQVLGAPQAPHEAAAVASR